MLKWPMWLRVVLGAGAVLICVALAFLSKSVLGDYSLFLILPGAAAFIYLNPELMRGD